MDTGQFVDLVAQRADITHVRTRARPLTDATLSTLAERLSGGEAAAVAAELPDELQHCLTGVDEAPERFDADEFVRRVAGRADIDESTAREGARAVFDVLHEAVPKGTWENLTTQLPNDHLTAFGLST
ncbi:MULTISPECIES: DUF2267 domain-containing protein [unclassified Curtobacterium]|uniref:DUF2267 domain-containing protein n=1 Tax=unclassified Curtobacterium TaxID=257496 RepID=UPI000DA7A642|nr:MULTISPECIES: DUF2267 domain-containing protein [unclassified Curtobacterium]PZE39287.1 DUF2267 domain-containing protein [Curtobacterium sp. MCPF17_031]PZF13564.1 DUF2267 domain-containing protein [Curtobacterium sp. MCPF17_011]